MDTNKILLSTFVGFLVFLFMLGVLMVSYFARQPKILTNYAIDPVHESLYGEYKKDEIIIKFRENSAETITFEDLQNAAKTESGSVDQILEMFGLTESSGQLPDSLVQLNKEFAIENIENVKGVSSGDLVEREKMPIQSVYSVSFKSQVPVIQLAQELSRRSDIEFAEPNYIVRIQAETPNDPQFGAQWGLNNIGQSGGTQDADIDAPEAWEVETAKTEPVIVAVLDTGVDTGHEDLTRRIWRNQDETVFNGIDDDGHGYIDDVHGWNFLAGDYNISDNEGHGTHVTGIIAAERNNAKGMAGVADNIKIMPVKFLNSNGEGTILDASRAVRYAVENGADVINCSFGVFAAMPPELLKESIEYAQDSGVLVITATGNDGKDINTPGNYMYPANYELDNIITVAALTKTDILSPFSNYSELYADLGAPGSEILSSIPDSKYAIRSGTSMAAPFVSGAVAVAKSHSPDVDYKILRQKIFDSVDKLPALNGKIATGGRLNLYKLLAQSVTVSPTLSPSPTQTVSVTPVAGVCPFKFVGDADCKSSTNGKAITIIDYAIWYSEFIQECSKEKLAGCGADEDKDGDVMDANFNFAGTDHIMNDEVVTIFDYAAWVQGVTVGK